MANSLRSSGIDVRDDWERAALDALRAEWGEASFRQKSSQVVQRGLYAHFLRSDLCESADPQLPSNFLDRSSSTVHGSFVLQVNELLNIGETAEHRRKDSAQRCLKMHMTDGARTLFGLEIGHLRDLSVHSRPGVKIIVRNPEQRHGVLLLHPGNTVVLGGMVHELQKFQDAAHEAGKAIHDAHLARTMSTSGSGASNRPPGGPERLPETVSASETRPQGDRTLQMPKRAKLNRQASGRSSREDDLPVVANETKQIIQDIDVEEYMLQEVEVQHELEEEILRQVEMSAAEKPEEKKLKHPKAPVPEALEHDDSFLENEDVLREIDAQVAKATIERVSAQAKHQCSGRSSAASRSKFSAARKKSPKRKRSGSPKRAAAEAEAEGGMKQTTLSQTFQKPPPGENAADEFKASPMRSSVLLHRRSSAAPPIEAGVGPDLLSDWLDEDKRGKQLLVIHGALVALKSNIRSKKKIGLFAEAEVTDGSRSALCLLPNAICEKLLGLKAHEMRAMAREDPEQARQEAQKFAESAVKMHGVLELRKREPDRISLAVVSLESFREPGEQDVVGLIESLKQRYRIPKSAAVR